MQQCQQESVPGLLLSFIHMLTGSSYDPASNKTNLSAHIPALSITQLIQFNNVAEQRTSRQFRYNADKETRLSIYVAFLLHSHTSSRLLIVKFYDLGLCISYRQMLALSTSLGNSMCELFEQEGSVCPPLLQSNVFMIHTMDNMITTWAPLQQVILGMAQQYQQHSILSMPMIVFNGHHSNCQRQRQIHFANFLLPTQPSSCMCWSQKMYWLHQGWCQVKTR